MGGIVCCGGVWHPAVRSHLLVELHRLDAEADEAREEGLVQAGVPIVV